MISTSSFFRDKVFQCPIPTIKINKHPCLLLVSLDLLLSSDVCAYVEVAFFGVLPIDAVELLPTYYTALRLSVSASLDLTDRQYVDHI